MKKVIVGLVSFIMVTNAYSVADNSSAEELANLKAQILKLERQIKKFEETHAVSTKPVQPVEQQVQVASVSTPEVKGKTETKEHKKHWKIPGTSTEMAIEGFVKLTCSKDVKGSTGLAGDAPGAGRNFLVARSIGLDGTNNIPSRDFYMHARESRFILKTLTPIDEKDLTTCVEMDFLGDPASNALVANGYNLRLRKAYGQFGHFLVGQDWSTYSDISTFGETVERNGPVGNSQVRQPLIRYSTDSYNDCKFFFSVENPESEFITHKGTLASSSSSITDNNKGYVDDIKGENRLPDFVVAMAYERPWGNIKLAGVIRENSVMRESDHERERALGAFFGTSVLWKLFDHDEAVIHIGYGSGGGRYFMDSMKAATYYDGYKLHNQYAYHFSFCYKHQWQEEYNLRSTISWGWLRNLNCDSLVNDIRNNVVSFDNANKINKFVMSIHANLIGNINKNLQAGIEYVVGKRKAETGLAGTLQRIVFAVQFNF
ncbi:MAG: porin [Alphaproteobacteria bacterium]|nr:porin [Alphaproteobacteria bacterium]